MVVNYPCSSFRHGYTFPQPIRARQKWIEDQLVAAKRGLEEVDSPTQDQLTAYLFRVANIKSCRDRTHPVPEEGDEDEEDEGDEDLDLD